MTRHFKTAGQEAGGVLLVIAALDWPEKRYRCRLSACSDSISTTSGLAHISRLSFFLS